MEIMNVEQYNEIMKIMNPVFYVFVVVFFSKEFSILFSWGLFVDYIPDLLFFIDFLVYAIFYITPLFYPETVKGYELPKVEYQEEEDELTEEERELKELEKISL